MKLFYLPLCFFLLQTLFAPLSAQVKRCGTMEVYQSHAENNPGLNEWKEKLETAASQWLKTNNVQKGGPALITIPVVFHVIYNVDSLQQNIHDSLIQSQLDVLNEDFRRLNSDTDDVRTIFDSLAADIGIEFCLATTDPNGNSTSGILRVPTNVKAFEFLNNQQDDMKFSSKGGDDAWPRDSFLNIWTCYMTIFNSPGVLGYSHFPWDTSAATDGVVLLYNVVGRNSKVFEMAPGEGETATHEVGHWLGLFHTWGNESFFPGCDSSDYVDDTPNQNSQSNFDCNKTINSCPNELPYWNSQNPPDLVEDYMDYSNDSCMCLFTKGQKDRMLSFLNTSRVGLFSSNGCDSSTSIKAIRNESPVFNLYPNPSTGIVNVISQQPGFTLELFTVYGQKLFSKSYYVNKQEINLSDLPAGYYIAKFRAGNSECVKNMIISE